MKGKIPTVLVSGPLDELLQNFGDSSPFDVERGESVSQINAQVVPPNRLKVSQMNVAIVKDMANVQII